MFSRIKHSPIVSKGDFYVNKTHWFRVVSFFITKYISNALYFYKFYTLDKHTGYPFDFATCSTVKILLNDDLNVKLRTSASLKRNK